MHGNQVVIYTPPAAGSSAKFWQRNVLDDSLIEGHAVACGDLIGIGSDQIVIGWRGKKQGTKWESNSSCRSISKANHGSKLW